MKAEIICVGTELLLGDILNTNAQYLARQLSEIGISVYNQQVVGDNSQRLKQAVEIAKDRSDIVILSGGLGPTEDDLTKQTVAGVYNDTLVFNKEVSDEIRSYFKNAGREMTLNNERQAYTPQKGKFLHNDNGTAPGIVFMDGEKLAVLLPGPPKELQPMVEKSVLPLLKKLVKGVIISRYVNVIGIGESALENKIKPLLQGENPTMALYAKEGEVQVRITASAQSKEEAERLIDTLYFKLDDMINPYIYGVDVKNIETVLINKLIDSQKTVATAESCTGGSLSARLTSVSGASAAFQLGVCTYSDEQKMKILQVKEEDLATYTAVSSVVAAQMAQGILEKAESDYAIATTGYAGPGGGTPQEPVGTVYIAVATKDAVYTKKCFFSGDREKITHLAGQNALDLLRCVMYDLPLIGVKGEINSSFEEEEYEEDEDQPKKKGFFLRFLLTFILLLLLAGGAAYGWLWYKNDGKLPQIDFSNINLPTFEFLTNRTKADIPKLIGERQNSNFFSQGFEKDTLKMLKGLSSQNQNVEGWLTFKSLKAEYPLTDEAYAKTNDFSIYKAAEPKIKNYTFISGFTKENFADFTQEAIVKANSSFVLFENSSYTDYQIFSVGAYSGEDLGQLCTLENSQDFIVNARSRSLFEVDVVVKQDEALTMLVQEVDNDKYVVIFAKKGSRDIFPSVDPKALVYCADWYKELNGITQNQSGDAVLYAQETYDRDNFDISLILKPTPSPTIDPDTSPEISPSPSVKPGVSPNPSPSVKPGVSPNPSPSVKPGVSPNPSPSVKPGVSPKPTPSVKPTPTPNVKPTATPGVKPTPVASPTPQETPQVKPTQSPTQPPQPVGEQLTVTMNGTVITGPVADILSQIVALEMTSSWNVEALKAQAVATHTYLIYQYNSGNSAPAVSGRSSPNQRVKDAVSQVSDLIMTVNGRAVYTPYCASVAGRTNPSSQVWGSNLSHLQSVESAYDYLSTGYERAYTFSMEDMKAVMEEKLGITLDAEKPETWFEILSYTDGGYVNTMRIGDATTHEGRTITGLRFKDNILAASGTTLRSAAFDIKYADGIFTITTKGYGHGVGLSQWGAQFYAQNEGWSYSQILNHYYTGVTLTQVS